MQYKAGYFLNSIYDLFLNKATKEKVEKIVSGLSHFHLETSVKLKHKQVDYISEINVVNNIINRGTATHPSTFIEDLFATTLNANKKDVSNRNHISYPFKDDSLTEEIYRAIHVIDPRINRENQIEYQNNESFDKDDGLKFDFKYSVLPEYLGKYFIQLVDERRDYKSLLTTSRYKGIKEVLERKYNQIIDKKGDFIIEMPYEHQGSKGLMIELDNTPTDTKYDHEIEQLKQKYCSEIGYSAPLIVDTFNMAESNKMLLPAINFTYNEYFDTIAKNYRSPLYNSPEGISAMQYALSPFAIARIQKTIIEYLLSGKLSLKSASWNIAIVERDVPCAHLAIQDLKLHFNNLFSLKGEKKEFPHVNLDIYRTLEFKNAKLNSIYPGTIKQIENFNSETDYDLLIDISVLQRNGLINKPLNSKAKNTATIRSVRSSLGDNTIYTSKPISFFDIFSEKSTDSDKETAFDSLKYFLRNIFRKDIFLSGQAELINNTLQRRNNLGYLPTRGGKSIAYQLAAILQPGVSIVINPVMSSMTDQRVNLRRSGIDKLVAINESIKDIEKLTEELNQFENGNCLFAFISSDFLRKRAFINSCNKLKDNKTFISQIVVDEAHCVSEWSHDFRPLYHGLGTIKKQLFENIDKLNIPSVALSATVGYSCLNDILKEFEIDEKDLVKHLSTDLNLNYRIIDTTSNQIQPEMTLKEIENLVAGRKQVHFSFLIKELFPEQKRKKERQDTVIYCPTPYGKTGVSDKFGDGLADKLRTNFENLKIGSFLGTTDDGADNVPYQDAVKSEIDYNLFIKDELDILVATKAFGIGTSKSNIRNLVYFSPPASIEGFIQESYRAGRDGIETTCSIVTDNQEFTIEASDPVSKLLPDGKCTFDKYLSYSEIFKKYNGKEKELLVINELISKIEAPSFNYLELLNKLLQDEYIINLQMTLQPSDNPNRLYLNESDGTYGYIDLINYDINSEESSFDVLLSKELLNFTLKEIKKRNWNKNEIVGILQSHVYKKETIGLLPILEEIGTGALKEVNIPFENNSLLLINDLLSKEVSTSFNKEKIRFLYNQSNSFESFLSLIQKVKTIKKKKIIENLEDLYNKIRVKYNTHLAIYRLSKLGFIDSYIIDELNHQFVTKVRKKTDEAYLLKLYDIFNDFLLPEKAVEKKMELSKLEGNNINKAINSYLEFCYDYIVRERYSSIETLYKLISEIRENESGKNKSNKEIKGFFDNYFIAKYSDPKYGTLPGTTPLNSPEQDFNVIKNYLAGMGPLKENWKHLKESTRIVSERLPDNYIPYLLNAYINLANGEQNEELIDESFDIIAQGFIRMRRQEGYELDNYEKDIHTFLNYLYETRPDLKETYEPILWLRLHYIWLKDFNKGIRN